MQSVLKICDKSIKNFYSEGLRQNLMTPNEINQVTVVICSHSFVIDCHLIFESLNFQIFKLANYQIV